tara:strand:+ start:292 stop:540 length:249 start_codon:yes stop_codon:yes gene_type:complete
MRPSKYHTIMNGDEVVEQILLQYDWHELRMFRCDCLNNTDWLAVKDRTMSQAWKDYRQALRDLPADYPDPMVAVDHWPEPPE